MQPNDPTARFSSRVADYVRYRPGYPPALLDWLHRDIGVPATTPVADIGAGTGISTRLLLDAGHPVVAVEPNAAMRAAAEHWLTADHPQLTFVAGTAEATTLADASVGLVSAAQAFHWFDTGALRPEWRRILRPGGMALVYWNSRLLDASPFLSGYEQLLLDYGTDYDAVAERYPDDDAMRAWFGRGLRGQLQLPNTQHLDFDGLRGRLLSSSYAPQAGHPRHEPMLHALRALFDTHAVDGRVAFEYRTRAFVGTLD
ncbi:class I SAM-dependent methyltransferase [Stenotrophomonas sp. Y6]|uniref:class I SAM-dependent methyltransferase n=1 Tax=Stenotrophomonas sp. Y6 TaxID=2920383 RepID=UPI001F067F1A|nr:class I SAM-dependent methyltransferase [Stenotrophomonas sp. Y6]